jgi:hypothetical protein
MKPTYPLLLSELERLLSQSGDAYPDPLCEGFSTREHAVLHDCES